MDKGKFTHIIALIWFCFTLQSLQGTLGSVLDLGYDICACNATNLNSISCMQIHSFVL